MSIKAQFAEMIQPELVVVGIDGGKYKQVAVATSADGRRGKAFTFETSRCGFESFLRYSEQHQQAFGCRGFVVALEPTGHYGEPLAQWLMAHDIAVYSVPDEFLAANYSGLSFARVEFSKPLRDVELWEMVVLGRAWREGSTPESLVACEICGRMEFPAPKNIVVDERQWDGSDFFFVDENPSVIVVTERVAEFVATKAFSNLATIDLA